MTEEEIKSLITKEVEKKIREEKKLLARIVQNELLYTGEFAKSHRVIRAVSDWAKD